MSNSRSIGTFIRQTLACNIKRRRGFKLCTQIIYRNCENCRHSERTQDAGTTASSIYMCCMSFLSRKYERHTIWIAKVPIHLFNKCTSKECLCFKMLFWSVKIMLYSYTYAWLIAFSVHVFKTVPIFVQLAETNACSYIEMHNHMTHLTLIKEPIKHWGEFLQTF